MEKQTKRKKKKTWVKVVEYMFIYLLFIFMGFSLGMICQQKLTAIIIGDALSYTNIKVDVNFNETKLTQELQDKFIPAFKEAINQSLLKGGLNSSQP